MQTNEGSELVFVIETCHNCKDHQWNTRHNEERYQEFFNRGKFHDLRAAAPRSPRRHLEAQNGLNLTFICV